MISANALANTINVYISHDIIVYNIQTILMALTALW